MNNNFFQWICYDVNDLDNEKNYIFTKTQSYLPLEECECKGQDYSGMPSIQLLAEQDEARMNGED